MIKRSNTQDRTDMHRRMDRGLVSGTKIMRKIWDKNPYFYVLPIMYLRLPSLFLTLAVLAGCTDHNKSASSGSDYAPGTFGYDLHFLQQHDSVFVLSSGETRVIVSPKYQAKVFTSTADGDTGPSFGWIHYKAFDGP